MARLRGTRWQADVRTPDGNRLRPTFKTESEAEAWESEARAAIEKGQPVPEPGTGLAGKRDLATLGSLFDHVSRTHWSALRSGVTLIRCGKEVVEHFGRNALVEAITAADIADFAASRAELGQSKATTNRKLAALSKMLKVAHRAGAIDRVPPIDWWREVKTKFRYLDDAEERAMLAYWLVVGDQDQHDLTMFLVDTGARCFTEAAPIKWEDCGGKIATFWSTKSNRPRTVPLTTRCRDMLARRKALRPGSWGPFQGIAKNTMRGRWERMRDTLGFHDVTPHTMRHTCCTRLIQGGADVRRVMEWLGHATIETTLRYAQVRPRSLEDILFILEGEQRAT